MKDFKNYYFKIFYKIKKWDWYLISYGTGSAIFGFLLFVYIRTNIFDFNIKESLSLILTINGLFSAILVTYFFNRVSLILESKKEFYNEAQSFSQKITEFRRILNTLTKTYNVWTDDNDTKSLLEHGKYKNVDYYDFKYMSISDYIPNNHLLIEELKKDKRFGEDSEMFLAMVSLVYDRGNSRAYFQDELYKDFEKKGIYQFDFIERCIDIEHVVRLGGRFSDNNNYIQYYNLGEEKRKYIIDAAVRVDKKYKNLKLNDDFMAELCDDMSEHYFKELYSLLLILRKGLSSFNLLIFLILFLSLIFGILLPFFTYFFIIDNRLQTIISELIVVLNFALLSFFTFSIYRLIKKEITWS